MHAWLGMHVPLTDTQPPHARAGGPMALPYGMNRPYEGGLAPCGRYPSLGFVLVCKLFALRVPRLLHI